MRFENKSILITGGSSGIGKAAALAFAREGGQMVIWDMQEEAGLALVRDIEQEGGSGRFVKVDVADPQQITHAFELGDQEEEKLDIAVNAAGIGGVQSTTEMYPPEAWARVLAVNLTGVFHCMQGQLERMKRQGAGAIINVASVAGVTGFPLHAAYAASKHGVIGLTRTAALESVREGVRVNVVCPGFTDTPMVDEIHKGDPAVRKKLERRLPIGRLGTPEEIAAAILFLASEEASFMAGHAMILDGGITA